MTHGRREPLVERLLVLGGDLSREQGGGFVEDVLDAVRRGRQPGTRAGRTARRRRLALGHRGEGGERASRRRPAAVPQVEQHLFSWCTLAEIHTSGSRGCHVAAAAPGTLGQGRGAAPGRLPLARRRRKGKTWQLSAE